MGIYKRVLSIAGSDSGGGAGIQADLKTFAAMGCYGTTVITSLTAQNTTGVSAIYTVTPSFVLEQLSAVWTDIGADAVKIGMLHSPEIISAVAGFLKNCQAPNIVLDPVMIAKSGDRLLREEAAASLMDELFPLATVITPNLPEAAALLGRPLEGSESMEQAARDLAKLGPAAVLIKGGHLENESCLDLLYERHKDKATCFEALRVNTNNTHGTGCTLSAAIAAGLACGFSLSEAIGRAKDYLYGALIAGNSYRLGSGHGPVHHFWQFWK